MDVNYMVRRLKLCFAYKVLLNHPFTLVLNENAQMTV